jgi:hypothetical protein
MTPWIHAFFQKIFSLLFNNKTQWAGTNSFVALSPSHGVLLKKSTIRVTPSVHGQGPNVDGLQVPYAPSTAIDNDYGTIIIQLYTVVKTLTVTYSNAMA